jgi:hypothetical protein
MRLFVRLGANAGPQKNAGKSNAPFEFGIFLLFFGWLEQYSQVRRVGEAAMLLPSTRGSALLEYVGLAAVVSVGITGAVLSIGQAFHTGYETSALVVSSAQSVPPRVVELPPPPPTPPVLIPGNPPEDPEVTVFRFACFDEGMVSGGTIDIRSNNHFGPGFCLYADEGMWMANGNEFAYGSLVATPDYALLQTPPAGWNSNTGLLEAFQVIKLDIDVDRTLVTALNALVGDPMGQGLAYITDGAPVAIQGKKFDATQLRPHRLNTRLCQHNESITIPRGFVLEDLAFVTNCSIRFGQDVQVQNAVIASTSRDAQAFHAPHPIRVGRDDGCLAGGGAQLLTLGGARFAAALDLNGGQVVSTGPLDMAAQATGMGALLLSGESISGTSNIAMQFCGGGMGDNLVPEWWVQLLDWLDGIA